MGSGEGSEAFATFRHTAPIVVRQVRVLDDAVPPPNINEMWEEALDPEVGEELHRHTPTGCSMEDPTWRSNGGEQQVSGLATGQSQPDLSIGIPVQKGRRPKRRSWARSLNKMGSTVLAATTDRIGKVWKNVSTSTFLTPATSQGNRERRPSVAQRLVSFLAGRRGLYQQPTRSGSVGENQTRVLTQVLPRGVLRGVRCHSALAGFGTHWEAVSNVEEEEDLLDILERFDLSEECDQIHDFISHDWKTGRWLKFLALVTIYNSQAAAIGSALVCVICAVAPEIRLAAANQSKILPPLSVLVGTRLVQAHIAWPALLAAALSFVVLLFFWQRLRCMFCFCVTRLTFVDKICINQSDNALKEQGILGLAGFLRSSDRLVVLWSPRYLSRLWCVYELATWVHLKKDFRSTALFVPLAFTSSMLGGMIVVTLVLFVQLLFQYFLPAYSLASVLSLAVLLGPIAAFVLRRNVGELAGMQHQLEGFKVHDSECHCCNVGHKGPNDTQLPCDRKLVYETLRGWFAFDEGDMDLLTRKMPLDRFDAYVHEVVAPAVMDGVLSVKARYKRAVLLSAPLLWFLVTWVVGLAHSATTAELLRFGAEWVCVVLVVCPTTVEVSLRLCVLANRLRGEKSFDHGLRDFLLSILVTLGTLFFAVSQWYPLVLTRTIVESFIPQLCVTAAVLFISVLIFCAPRGFATS